VLNLEFSCGIAGAGGIDVGDSYQVGVGNQAAQIFRVPLAHFSYSQKPYAQFRHFRFLPKAKSLAVCRYADQDKFSCPHPPCRVEL